MKKFFFIASLLFFASCTTLDVYEKCKLFATQKWSSADSVTCVFDIKDSITPNNFYFVLRHTEKYPYKNIWLEINVKSPERTTNFKQEVTLADNDKWLGNATKIDEIVEHRILLDKQATPLHKGTYTFTIKQIMREDPLPYIMAAGIRVQKVSQ